MSTPIQNIPVRRITGEDTNLGEYNGKVLLVQSICASKCGLTSSTKVWKSFIVTTAIAVSWSPAFLPTISEPRNLAPTPKLRAFAPVILASTFPCLKRSPSWAREITPLYKELIAARPKATSTSDVPFSEKLKGHGIEPNDEPEILWNLGEVPG